MKFTNRFHEIGRETDKERKKEREKEGGERGRGGEHASKLLKYIEAEQKRNGGGEQRVAAAGGQEIAAKQAWQGMKG